MIQVSEKAWDIVPATRANNSFNNQSFVLRFWTDNVGGFEGWTSISFLKKNAALQVKLPVGDDTSILQCFARQGVKKNTLS